MSAPGGHNSGVVVGVDDSPESLRAVAVAAREAAARNVRLRIVHAILWPGYDPGDSGDPRARARVDAVLDAAAEVAWAAIPALEVDTEVVDGQGSEVLIRESERAELVVIGHRGLGDVSGLLTGALGMQLAGHTACPLLIVRERDVPDGPVIVGVDDLSSSDALLDVAFDQCRRTGRGLKVVHAWHLPTSLFAGREMPYSYDVLAAAAQATLAAEVERAQVRHPDVDVSCLTRYGPPTPALLDVAAGASLLIVGSRGAGGFRNLVLGSVATALSQHAPCPVLVVPGSHGATLLKVVV